MEVFKPLSDIEQKFVELYCLYNDPTGIQAAKEASPRKKSMQYVYLSRPHVRDAIKAQGGPEPILECRALTTLEHRILDAYLETFDFKKASEIVDISYALFKDYMKRPHIRFELEKRLEEVRAKSIIKAEEVIEELALIAFADIGDYVDFTPTGFALKNKEDMPTTAVIAEVSNSAHGVKFKMHDKMRSLESLAKVLGLFKEKLEITGKDGEPIQIESPLDVLSAKLDAMSKNRKLSEEADAVEKGEQN